MIITMWLALRMRDDDDGLPERGQNRKGLKVGCWKNLYNNVLSLPEVVPFFYWLSYRRSSV